MQQPASRILTTPGEAIIITLICFGVPILNSVYAMLTGFPSERSGGAAVFTDSAMIWLIVSEVVMASAALSILRIRRYAIGSLYPHPTLFGTIAGIALFIASWLFGWMLVGPFVTPHAQQPIDHMLRQSSLSLPVVIAVAMVNGTYEEMFLLGFLLRGLRGFGVSVALGAMLLIRVLYHLYQGPIAALWVLGAGLVFGLYYLRTGVLWPSVFAHILWDIVPFVSHHS